MMLPDDELTAIRAAIADLLPDECYILTATSTRGTNGEVTQTWGTATLTTPCRFDPIRGSEQNAAGGVVTFYGYKVTLPYSTTITAANRLSYDGAVYNIKTVDSNKSWRGSLRLEVERV